MNDAAGSSTAERLTLRQRLRADYRFYSGAFDEPAQPKGGLLSRWWAASMKLGFWVMVSYRLRHAMQHRGRVLHRLGEWIGFWTKIMSGCHISAKCIMGLDVSFPHPVGIVIGDRVVIGNGAKIYQGVTLGSSGIGRDSYPVLEENVTVFTNAVIVGHITIGANAVVGAGAIVLHDVPAACSAVGNPARVVRPRGAAIEHTTVGLKAG